MALKIAIVGSRRFNDLSFVMAKFMEVWQEIIKENPDLRMNDESVVIVSGGASGVDSSAQELARALGLPIKIFYPNWKLYGKSADPIRTEKIVQEADVVIAFPDKKSKGTWDTINKAKKKGKRLFIFQV